MMFWLILLRMPTEPSKCSAYYLVFYIMIVPLRRIYCVHRHSYHRYYSSLSHPICSYTLHPNFLFLRLTNAATLHSFEKKKKLSLIFNYFYRATPVFLFQKIIVVNFAKVQPVSTTHEFMSCIKLTLYTTATQL